MQCDGESCVPVFKSSRDNKVKKEFSTIKHKGKLAAKRGF